MPGDLSVWEALLMSGAVLLVILFFGPGIKNTIARSREVPSNWKAVMLPLAGLLIFVLLLISLARG